MRRSYAEQLIDSDEHVSMTIANPMSHETPNQTPIMSEMEQNTPKVR